MARASEEQRRLRETQPSVSVLDSFTCLVHEPKIECTRPQSLLYDVHRGILIKGDIREYDIQRIVRRFLRKSVLVSPKSDGKINFRGQIDEIVRKVEPLNLHVLLSFFVY